jgi:hypothetical protein
MAWRIGDCVVRGEIDNRQKGVTQGRIWLEGYAEPVVLELEGNACPDLAGCLLRFTNPQPTGPMRSDKGFALLQRGSIGDLTASRKVRSSAGTSDDRECDQLSNCLYLEWFSEANGRVIIESADYLLQVSPAEWRLTPGEEKERQTAADSAWANFINALNAAVHKHEQGIQDQDAKWNEHDYERFLKASDARADKLTELIDKFGHSEEAWEAIEQAMGWTDELDEQQLAAEEMDGLAAASANEPEPEPSRLREGVNWIRTPDGDIRHPLQHRCFEAAIRISDRCEELGLSREDDDALALMFDEFHTTSIKLAGALGSIARGAEPFDPAFTVAYLKRALDHLHKTQAALETVGARRAEQSDCGRPTLPDALTAEIRRELFEIREGILDLMKQYRNQADSN